MPTKPCAMLGHGCYYCEHPVVVWCPTCGGWYCVPHDHTPSERQEQKAGQKEKHRDGGVR